MSYEFDEILIKDGYLPLTESLFNGDALVMEECQLGRVDLLDENRNMLVSLSFDAPVVGIWSPPHKNAPFVCIEPWYGRCDAEKYDGELQERDYECIFSVRPVPGQPYIKVITPDCGFPFSGSYSAADPEQHFPVIFNS